MRPLDGLVVLEMGQYIAAPYCAMMLADLGADVIKIERPGKGDPRRSYDPLIEDENGRLSGGFLSYNRNKRSVTLDLATHEGQTLYKRLAAKADVIIENLRPGAVDRLGIGYDALRQANPALIYCAISGYGRSPRRRGVYADRPAFDTAIQAMAGLMAITGEPGGPPLPTITGFADLFTAVHAACSVLASLQGRAHTGRGTFVDQSMYDSTASLIERELMLWDFTRQERRRGVDGYAPLGCLETSDGHIALIIPTDEMWRRMCRAIDREDLLNHPKLDSVLARAENFSTLVRPEAERWTRSRTRQEVVSHFSECGLPAGVVQTIPEVYDCPHLAARDMFLDVHDAHAGKRRMIRTPALLDGYELPRPASAPQLGADNDDVLRQMADATPHDLMRWRQAGVI
ncbi:CaiB/BaiF CoA transferase family protein [Streptomyces brasiliensis]|uniref:CoA transferase n=1 Tax=Streptomyces brasiliensis TaxID=1954 RepID=A0A917P402_9ACTN|nr:CoA transferase [Streptomyces brasiliensis]GGJ60534.1 CoA transferase [Streptomyces brasiliensis]